MKKRSLLIDGPVGQLEIRVHELQLDNAQKSAKLVVLNHPHPLYGGTMDNKVITTMEKAFINKGFNTVAFNFRGVGKSEGEYDSGDGEQADLIAVTNWARGLFNPQVTILAGFSFGSYVLLKSLPELSEVDAVCTVAPPVGLYDFTSVKEVEPSWSLIQGGEDEVICAKEALDWAMQLESTPDIYWRANASHFFHGELIWLRNLIKIIY